MKILDKIMGRSVEEKAAPRSGGMITGMREAPTRAAARMLDASDDSPWLSAVVDKISSAVGGAGWYAYRETASGEKPLGPNEPAQKMLIEPDPWFVGERLMGMAQAHVDLVGEAYLWVERSVSGKPVYLWPLLPSWVREVPGPMDASPAFRVDAGRTLHVPPLVPGSDMVWIRRPSAADPYGRGPGIARSVADEIDTDEQVARYIRAFFYNDATPSGIVSIEGATREAAEVFKHALNQRHRGVEQAHQVMVTGGKIDWKTLESAVKDLRAAELRGFQRDVIIQRFGIPPEILGILESSNRATIEAAAYLFAKWVVIPRADAMAVDMSRAWTRLFGQGVRVGHCLTAPRDDAMSVQVMTAFPRAFSVAEVRESAGLEARDGDDDEPAASSPPVFEPAPPMKAAPEIVTKDRQISASVVREVVNAIKAEELRKTVSPAVEDAMTGAATRELGRLGVQISFDTHAPEVAKFIEMIGARLMDANKTTQEIVRGSLLEGIAEGERNEALSRRLRESLDGEISRSRALTIARTEAGAASNFGKMQASEQSGVVVGHEWISARSPTTRDEHAALDGAVAKLGAYFESGSLRTKYPGGSGVAEHDINCKCTITALTADDFEELSGQRRSSDMLDAVAKAMDAEIAPFEEAVDKAVRSAFAKQLEAALAVADF